MSSTTHTFEDADSVDTRARELLVEQQRAIYVHTDRTLAGLMLAQWVVSIGVAWFISPLTWAGKTSAIHVHVHAAIVLGGAITSVPVLLALFRPGWVVTRHVIAAGQMLWTALLIHLTGGRIETHFLVFGSLAFLATYRDWTVLAPATAVVAVDHLMRQLFWPESVFGIVAPEWWRFLEHAFYVVFEDVFLVQSCIRSTSEMRALAQRQADLEKARYFEAERSAELDLALETLKRYQESLIRTEKLAAVGKLAASVGHELRNPLAAIRSAHAYVVKKVGGAAEAQGDPRVVQFFGIIERELDACSRIISDLLDFARERKPDRRPTPLRSVVEEAISVVPVRDGVTVENQVAASLPVPALDPGQFRQVFINLVQNAVEAIPAGRSGKVTVSAGGGGTSAWRIVVADDGIGISEEARRSIFEPLFTTKTKGTGLGLAVVAGMVERHGGRIWVESREGHGTQFFIELPPPDPAQDDDLPVATAAAAR